MADVEKGGSPHGALEPGRITQQEAGGAGANLSALFMREQQGGKERSYEEMVALIKRAAEKERGRLGDYCFDPALWIRDQIIGRWREIKYQYIGALGSVAVIKNVRSKRPSWKF